MKAAFIKRLKYELLSTNFATKTNMMFWNNCLITFTMARFKKLYKKNLFVKEKLKKKEYIYISQLLYRNFEIKFIFHTTVKIFHQLK